MSATKPNESLKIQALKKRTIKLWKADQCGARELGDSLIALRGAMTHTHGAFANWFRKEGLLENRVYYCIRLAEGKKFDPSVNQSDGKHYWLTPPALLRQLKTEFHFDFDPCPYPKPEHFDGLKAEWGRCNYVNPPFWTENKVGITAWIRKAIEEQQKGKTSVVVVPVYSWVLMALGATSNPDVRNLGNVHWLATEDGKPGPGGPSTIACFVLRGKHASTKPLTQSRAA